ncbi:hypothetical protein UFOVP130_37 [uncultured Caudovirales phage]|uniref:Uncharacterized protein n=1 Tax=uncultured Caudovirales phage TaxID=2100421 RepID=A0A6J5LCD6_9CAUD|nr:hypothetical protein UFOVP130_37 [uncultured Caudovirales phage]
MKNFKLTFLALFAALAMFGASPSAVESSRSHAAAGNYGCTVSGATVATPSVITCSAAHGLIDGDPIRITGVGGTTTVNTVGYAKITGYSTTTFGFYSDAALATGITGTGAYTSGGNVTQNYLVSGVTGDFTLRFRMESLTATKNVLVALQESQDGFVSDIRTFWVNSFTGSAQGSNTNQPFVDVTLRKYQLPMNRFGSANTAIRVNVQAIDGSTTLVSSMFVEQ